MLPYTKFPTGGGTNVVVARYFLGTKLCIGNDKTNVNEEETYVLRKLKTANFIISDKCVKGVVEENNDSIDFSQYKHKKIRRISKDSEPKDNMKKSYAIIEQFENTSENGTKHDKIRIQTANKELEKEIKHIEKKQKNKKDKNKKKRKDKKKKKKKDKKEKEYDDKNGEYHHKTILKVADYSSSCTLQAADLTDGLRIIKRTSGLFYPGRLTEISAPDIYGIVVDRERGNKPHILTQEEVINEAVRVNIDIY